MADNETITDIIADMRRDADADDITPDCILGQKLNYLADRLEAAFKREMSKNVSKNGADFGQLGNAAKLREVVGDLLYMAERYVKKTPATESVIFDAKTKKEIRTVNYYGVIAKAQAVRAEPPRNCDMPLVVNGPADNNADKAWLVFKRHNPDAYFDVPGLLRCIDWLLATATKKKGENDGSK